MSDAVALRPAAGPASPTSSAVSPAGALAVAEAAGAAATGPGLVRAEACPPGGARGPVGGWQKRAVDIVIALVALTLAAPLILLLMALIRLSTGSGAIFAHRRVGYDGRVFDCYKLRTMVPDGEEILQRHLANDPEAMREWLATRKLQRDPRVTTLGYMLRRSSLDELPQLVNVLRGEMSCVGPRPIMADELERYGPHAADYLAAKPGLTGAWQVSGRSRLSYGERVAMDVDYVRNWSLRTDFAILLKTIFVVMKCDGSC
ncbi:sugar transferase [Chelatococcus sp. SYSU_G07232]|uniref:Sugar transferase n=1 Tax=Chelatococcus albus TaxID=3047466 RepID=A0ABT7ACI3_9HYPH|nr:sugar transferase [Chelatococcus sp. SYSU_G07232]MDJ1157082.1 sugar transferase [Chelatococcus sp. SYSU_G07232]